MTEKVPKSCVRLDKPHKANTPATVARVSEQSYLPPGSPAVSHSSEWPDLLLCKGNPVLTRNTIA